MEFLHFIAEEKIQKAIRQANLIISPTLISSQGWQESKAFIDYERK